MKITDTARIDFLAEQAWRLSYDEPELGRFVWRVHQLTRTSKPNKNIRKAIDAAIRAEAKRKSGRGK